MSATKHGQRSATIVHLRRKIHKSMVSELSEDSDAHRLRMHGSNMVHTAFLGAIPATLVWPMRCLFAGIPKGCLRCDTAAGLAESAGICPARGKAALPLRKNTSMTINGSEHNRQV